MKSHKNNNLKLPKLGFGGAPIGNLFIDLNDKEAEEILLEAKNSGINYFDTSPLYGCGLSEIRIGNFIKNYNREDFIISTKVGRYLEKVNNLDGINRGFFKSGLNLKTVLDYSYDGTMKSFEQSLNRLNTNYIDICLIHDVDYFNHKEKLDYYFDQSIKGSYKAIRKLKEEKVIKAIGIGVNDSDVANRFLKKEKFDYVLIAGRYTLLDQSASDDLFKTAENNNVKVILGGVFNSGILAKGENNSTFFYQPTPQKIKKRYIEIKKICENFNISIQSVAIQFAHKPKVVESIVIGMDNIKQINNNINYFENEIPDELWSELNKINIKNNVSIKKNM